MSDTPSDSRRNLQDLRPAAALLAVAAVFLPVPGCLPGEESCPVPRLRRVETLDPLLDEWSNFGRMPRTLSWVEAVELADEIYVIGQTGPPLDPDLRCYHFDPITRTWQRLDDAPSFRRDISLVSLGTDIYMLGGAVGGQLGTNLVEVLDTTNGTWSVGPDMIFDHYQVAAAVVGGKIYAMGGASDSVEPGEVEVLDPAIGVWQSLMPMPEQVINPTAESDGTFIYVFGEFGLPRTHQIQTFDPLFEAWIPSPALPPLVGIGRSAIIGSQIYISLRGWGGLRDAVITYETITETWTILPEKGVNARQSAVAAASGALFSIAGRGPARCD